tara:strand:+ start:1170 stop:1523 length:354 start_codon:yes stop_codon:yes gene_type:complete
MIMDLNITITEAAANHINTLMKNAPEGVSAMRLGIGTTGCSGNSYKMEYVHQDEDKSGDDLVESGSASILIPKIYSWMLIGLTIDYITDDIGNSRFDFINPNETARCGCGESFTVQR